MHAGGLDARQVGVTRKGRVVLRDVSLSLGAGEVVAVIGPNGAGKSTLLQAMAGTLAPSSGSVCLDGVPLGSMDRRILAQRRAVLPQTAELAFGFSVLDVVLLGRAPHGEGAVGSRDLQHVEAALAQTGVAHLAARSYLALSGGERQRVQLARVLAQIWPDQEDDPPRYLLLDEPTNNLDLAHQHALMRTARDFAARGVGVLAILHDPNLAARYADRVAVLKEGALCCDGPPDAVLTEHLMGETFGVESLILRHPDTGRPLVVPV
ncbi:MAG: heme ABC transporter ATP-binding protein [Pseudomonadales bacterium]|nr:heme ABC transporter ATP-binding protein [Pseudomonadales bacterium]